MEDNQVGGIERALGRVEAALKGQTEWQSGHDADDKLAFSEIRYNFAAQDRRLAVLEGIVDTVESHGNAIAEIEQRVSESEERDKVRRAASDRDRVWIRWTFLLLLSLVLDHFSGSKLAGWVGDVLK